MSTRLSMRSRNGHSRLTAALDVEPSRTLRVARTVRVRIRYPWMLELGKLPGTTTSPKGTALYRLAHDAAPSFVVPGPAIRVGLVVSRA